MSVYPSIPDFADALRERAPGVLGQPNAWALTDALVAPLGDLDDQQGELIRQMDPEVATGGLLDLCGARVFEARAGLGDVEYRRIIAGREASRSAAGTLPGIWRTWLALTGVNPDRARIMRWGPVANPMVIVWAQYDTIPTVQFLRRGGSVLLDAVAFPFDVSAFLVPAGGFMFDTLPGFDGPVLPYQFRTVRA